MVQSWKFWRRASRPKGRTGKLAGAHDERIYAVGDIHGRSDLLGRMLHIIERDAEAARGDGRRTRLIFLGDYVDRGDDSRGVLQRLHELRNACRWAETSFLKGNHEDAMLAFLDDPISGAGWLRFGGRQTLASYGVWIPEAVDEMVLWRARDIFSAALGPERRFLTEALEPMARSGDLVFTHAGVDPGRSVNSQPQEALIWGTPRFKNGDGIDGIMVVHGHYAGDTVRRTACALCIDTGAYYTGRLTAVRFDDEETLLST